VFFKWQWPQKNEVNEGRYQNASVLLN